MGVIIVRGWPEDATWRREVGDVLTRGVPALVSLIGLPWPVAGPLSVVEVHTPLLEGYAGFYNPARSEITGIGVVTTSMMGCSGSVTARIFSRIGARKSEI